MNILDAEESRNKSISNANNEEGQNRDQSKGMIRMLSPVTQRMNFNKTEN